MEERGHIVYMLPNFTVNLIPSNACGHSLNDIPKHTIRTASAVYASLSSLHWKL